MSDTSPPTEADLVDAKRYRRLRLLGCAPFGTAHLDAGHVLRFQNLDDFVDCDIAVVPSRGEAT